MLGSDSIWGGRWRWAEGDGGVQDGVEVKTGNEWSAGGQRSETLGRMRTEDGFPIAVLQSGRWLAQRCS